MHDHYCYHDDNKIHITYNLLTRLSVAECRQLDFLFHPTHSRETHCVQLPTIITDQADMQQHNKSQLSLPSLWGQQMSINPCIYME